MSNNEVAAMKLQCPLYDWNSLSQATDSHATTREVQLEEESVGSHKTIRSRSSDWSPPSMVNAKLNSVDKTHMNAKVSRTDPFLTTPEYIDSSQSLWETMSQHHSLRHIIPTRDCFHLPHGDYVDDSRNLYSGNYNQCSFNALTDHVTPTRSFPCHATTELPDKSIFNDRAAGVASVSRFLWPFDMSYH